MMSKSIQLAALVTLSLAVYGTFSSPAQAAPTAVLALSAPSALPPSETLTRLGINPKVLADLLKQGAASHSDAIVIIKNDEVVGQWYFGKTPKPIEAMSVTKSIAALAIGCLLHDGKLKSLDEPVCDFYPEWNQGRKKLITVRQLLNHTSGLQAETVGDDIHNRLDAVQLALCAELSSDPGATFLYNNKAVNLLAGIVEKASGQRLDRYMDTRIFAPLGIRDYQWNTDPAGNPFVYSQLQIHALDLAKIGQLMADDGMWHGKRLLDSAWIAEMTAQPGQLLEPDCGLLWWLEHKQIRVTIDAGILDEWRQGGVPATYIAGAAPLVGQTLPPAELMAKLNVVFGSHENKLKYLYNRSIPQFRLASPTVAYNANGSLGQYLVVVPKEHLVVVRQISYDSFKSKDTDEFASLLKLAPALVGEEVEDQ